MDASYQHYYKINEILMSCLGQWPYQKKIKRHVFPLILMLFCTGQLGVQIMAMVVNIHDPERVIECISPILFEVVCFTKLINCVANSDRLLKLMNRIGEDWTVWSCDREIRILHEYAAKGRKMVILYSVVIYLTGIVFVTQPILPKIIDVLLNNGTEPGVFPVPVYYHRLDEQKFYFYLIGYTYACLSILLVIIIAGDSMFIIHVYHCCGIFAALGRKLERLGKNKTLNDRRDRDFVYLSMCIDRHNMAIEYAKLIESTYSGYFLLFVGFNMLMISVTALQIFGKNNEPQDNVRFVIFVGAQMIHLYIESYISQMLMDHSLSIRHSAHKGKWYNVSLKSQKLLNLLMMRCNLPCKLTVGKMYTMSVETFGMAVKSSISYFLLLRPTDY